MTWRFASLIAALPLIVAAQDPADFGAGAIHVTVLDAFTHAPVRNANVSLNRAGQPPKYNFVVRRTVTTDANGSATFDQLPDGVYQLRPGHRDYPEARGKSLTLAEDEATDVTLTLKPGASVSGHVLDEDGDPIESCFVQVGATSAPPYMANRGQNFERSAETGPDGAYRVTNVPAGQYLAVAHCTSPVFQPRPLSSGTDPPASSGWPAIYSQTIELDAGAERSGIDFRMIPRPVTPVHVTILGAGPEAKSGLSWALIPVPERTADFYRWQELRGNDNSFDTTAFPGSYALVVRPFVNASAAAEGRGAYQSVTVGDEPLAITAEVRPALSISGRIEMENADADQTSRILQNAGIFAEPQIPRIAGESEKPEPDGTFTFHTAFPVRLRLLRITGAYVKSISAGGRDFTGGIIGPAEVSGELRVVLGTNTATIQGTAPAGMPVYYRDADGDAFAVPVDEYGRFRITGLGPGSYRIVDSAVSSFDASDAQSITVHEGEMVNLELKPPEAQ